MQHISSSPTSSLVASLLAKSLIALLVAPRLKLTKFSSTDKSSPATSALQSSFRLISSASSAVGFGLEAPTCQSGQQPWEKDRRARHGDGDSVIVRLAITIVS